MRPIKLGPPFSVATEIWLKKTLLDIWMDVKLSGKSLGWLLPLPSEFLWCNHNIATITRNRRPQRMSAANEVL
jgi:hypothetical protein